MDAEELYERTAPYLSRPEKIKDIIFAEKGNVKERLLDALEGADALLRTDIRIVLNFIEDN